MKLARNRLGAAPAVAAVLGILALGMPSGAQADFTIENFDTFICPSDVAPAPPGTCTGNTAPAGAHRAATVEFDFGGDEPVHDIIQHFPIGIIPNPENVAKCPEASVDLPVPVCPANSQLGTTNLVVDASLPDPLGGLLPPIEVTLTGKVYNLEVSPPYVGGLAFITEAGGLLPVAALKAPFTIRTAESKLPFLTDTLAPGDLDGPGVGTFSSPPVTPHKQDAGLTGLSAEVPDNVEGIPIRIKHIDYTLNGTNQATGAGLLAGKPYISLSTGCLTGKASVQATSHANPTQKVGGTDPNGSNFSGVGTTTDCDNTNPAFSPEIGPVTLGTDRADTPSSYDIEVAGLDDGPYPPGEPRHESDLRRAQVTLPEGTGLSPAAADGLEACTDAQLGEGNNEDPQCPPASDIGDIEVTTNNLPASNQPTGNVYLGKPTADDDFRLFLAFEIVDGLWVKQKGVAKPDPQTGQITTVFDKLPALPFKSTRLRMERPDGTPLLVNPANCGSHTVTSVLTSFKFPPNFPADTTARTPTNSFNITDCAVPKPFDPTSAASTNPTKAGANSSLSLGMSVPDRHQLLRDLRIAMPAGLVGKLTGQPLCAAGSATNGNCPADTRIGSISTAVGAGDSPLSLPGSIYLAEKLQPGDPASLAVVVPAKAGPFDFGNVVVRARVILRNDGGLDIDLADDVPRFVEGVPLRVRDLGTSVDKPNFLVNPTNCGALQFKASFSAYEGAAKDSSSPYQVSGCETLPFSPKLRFIAGGETKRFGHPSLKAIVTQGPGEANIARSNVILPDILRPETVVLNKPGVLCQQAQADARVCAPQSRVGTAVAETPLLPQPLSGPVHIIQAPGNPLPKLIVYLDGVAPIRLEAHNSIVQSVKTLNEFRAVPDVPLSRFELNIEGGSNGILKNFGDLCTSPESKGDATFVAHSGRASNTKPPLELPVCVAANATPRLSVSVRRLRSTPTLKATIKRKGGTAAKLRRVTLTLPKQLRANAKRRKGITVRAGGKKLARKYYKLSRRKLTIKRNLPKGGAATVVVTLRKGAVKQAGAVRSRAKSRKRLPKMTFKAKATNSNGKKFKLKKRVRGKR